MESHQLRTGDAQVILGIHDHGFFQQAGVKCDFVETLEQQRVGDQRQIGVETKRRDSAEYAGGKGTYLGRAGEGGFKPAEMAGKPAQVGLQIGSQDRQNMLLTPFPFTLQTRAFAP